MEGVKFFLIFIYGKFFFQQVLNCSQSLQELIRNVASHDLHQHFDILFKILKLFILCAKVLRLQGCYLDTDSYFFPKYIQFLQNVYVHSNIISISYLLNSFLFL